ncbi:MAG: D-alanyl-D-alanine carboxypeptidase [Alphaproteobacteria bacterium]|nr:D-alanyl-D-alanine carboxypeptidase [Alphaproteobacteria bacterium]
MPGAALERAENGESIIMDCVPVGASRRLRWGCVSLAAIVAILAVSSDPADARRRHKRSHGKLTSISSSYNPPYAAIVVDANNGAVLHAAAPDAPRHPASLTKIMTLYLLFEQLEAGKIALDTPMDVSELASSQAPTKLGLRPGDTLKVEDAIKGLVTKSANDAAVVIAEALGGSEDEFARAMTRKARTLGMRNTTYRNANGLPNDEQITTARDQARLGMAIQERFPKYYRYFSLASFVYRGNAMRNHNRLLGKVEGVDGIKTGFTRDSGFNLVTSVKRGARRIVAVVLGGRSAGSRDAKMRELIEAKIGEATTKPGTALVAEATPESATATKPQLASADPPVSLGAGLAREVTAAISPGSSAPLTPIKVKTVAVKIVPPRNTPAAKSELARPELAKPELAKPEPVRTASVAPTQEEMLAETLAAAAPIEAVPSAPAPPPAPAPPSSPSTPPRAAHPGVLGKLPAMIAAAKEAAVPSAKAEEVPVVSSAQVPARHTARGGWVIQVGAYEDEGEAKQHLSTAKSKISQALHKAEAYIERTVKGAKTYYRARFAGFDRDQAEAVCKRLKREDVACMALKI